MSGGEHDAMVLYERSLSKWKVALEAVQGCVTRTEFEEFRGHVDQRFDQIANQMTLVVGELRGIRKDMAGHAQASELRALDQRVTALERRAGP
jgi:hypothetical protein